MNGSNLLFVCSRNQWRSPTAEKVYSRKGFSTRSAGTSPNAQRTVSARDIQWATHIFVMEKKHKQRINAKFNRLVEYKKIVVLDIPDEYQFMDNELVAIIESSIDHHL
ncbi:MAG: phosphotyrosine protein phosphatase [Pseudomonadota bacterium]